MNPAGFQKGHPPYAGIEKGQFKKGQHYSPSTEFKKGNIINLNRKRPDMLNNNFRLNIEPWNKGKPFSTIAKKRMSESRLKGLKEGRIKTWDKNKENKKIRGEKHPNWKGGISPINLQIRQSLEYKIWRRSVFERDNYTCQICGRKGCYLHAHHLKPFAEFPDLRFDTDNGLTLCRECHRKGDNINIFLMSNSSYGG